MDDMEKKTEEMKTGEVEMNQKMTERADWIDTQTYWYLMQLLEISTAEAEEKLRQEKRSLIKVNDSFKKIVVIKDNIRPQTDENGIVTIGLINFLLDENSLDL